MESRPKIKLQLSQFDKNLELCSKLFLILIWAFSFYVFYKMPDMIAIHFNSVGKADQYGNKIFLLILPALATIIYFGITKLNQYPHIFNYLTKITEGNARKQYTIATRLLRYLKLVSLLIFFLIILMTYLATMGMTNGLGFWFLPLMLALVFIPVIISIFQSLRK
ncbi:MAG: DUF1648 domain-containing protein [Bacteroidetes bacterium]|nr:DUF1648 domain-containing protein [Bacteroidota bacterium]